MRSAPAVTDPAGAALQVLISKEPTVAGRVAAHVADLEDELALLKQLDHPNIVRYLVGFLLTPAPGCLVSVMQ